MRAIASKINLNNKNNKTSKEFLDCILNILNSPKFQELSNFSQHLNTNRFQHCLNVSYYSFIWAKKLGINCKSAARAGLLHDFFLYDHHQIKSPQNHIFYHPKVAIKNSLSITKLSKQEFDAIINHMWPLCESMPKYKISYIVTFADKYCSVLEIFYQTYKKTKAFIKKSS